MPEGAVTLEGIFNLGKMEITLSNGMITIIDDEDFEKVNDRKWVAHKGKNGNFYARGRQKSTGKMVYMHRVIMNPDKNMCIDHINHNGL